MLFNLFIASLISVSVIGVIICIDASSDNVGRFKAVRKVSVSFPDVCNLGSLYSLSIGRMMQRHLLPLWVEILFYSMKGDRP